MLQKVSMESIGFWIDILSKVAIPVVIGLVGWHYSEVQRERDDVATVIQLVTSTDELAKNLGTSYAGDLMERNRLPTSVTATLIKFSVANKKETLFNVLLESTPNVKTAESVVTAIESTYENAPIESESAANLDNKINIPARIYFHVQSNNSEQRRMARKVSLKMEQDLAIAGRPIKVPGIQQVSATEYHQLRCFRAEECEALNEGTMTKLQKIVNNLQKVDLSKKYEHSNNIREYHYEIWFGPDQIVGEPSEI